MTHRSTLAYATTDSPTVPASRAAQALCRSLTHFFEEVCPGQHDVYIPVEAVTVESRGAPGPEGTPAHAIELSVLGSLSIEARFTIDHAGGNVYGISAEVENGAEKRFSCCLMSTSPEDVDTALGKTIGTFLMGEVERIVGRHVLRNFDALPSNESQRRNS